MSPFEIEIIGYLASIFIALSIMMSSIKRLRILNLLGCATFSLYGYLVDVYPVFLLNGWVAMVNGYYLIKMYYVNDKFDLIRLNSTNSPLFTLLKQSYGEDITQVFKHFEWQQLDNASVFLLFRNMKPVGIFAYKTLDNEGEAEVILDYTIPDERDFKVAKFLFMKENNQLNQAGVSRLIAKATNKKHALYLNRAGFVKSNNHFELLLN